MTIHTLHRWRHMLAIIGLLALARMCLAMSAAPGDGFRRIEDLAGQRIGYVTGTVFGPYLERNSRQAKLLALNNPTDLAQAILSRKVDAGVFAAVSAREIVRIHTNLAVLDGKVMSFPLGIGFAKHRAALRERFDRHLARLRADGRYQAIYDRWFTHDPAQAVMPDYRSARRGRNVERYVVAVAVADLPYVAYENGRYVGFDIELLQSWAAAEGIELTIRSLDFGALLPAIVAGKADLITDGIAITDERRKAVDFSAPTVEEHGVAVVLASRVAARTPLPAAGSAPAGKPGWLDELSGSIEATFIVESRWKLVAQGLGITILIAAFSTLGGTVLGGFICYLRMSPVPLLRAAGRAYIALLRGLPVLLLLMLIFYVVLARVAVDAVVVAIIAFGMNFAAYVAEMFRSGIQSVDKGQFEAGIAMGFSRVKAFIHIVLPQAVRTILPVYRGEFISLVKMTSIVGYIGVQDLTKASDIIRSRTFEAFFPLIVVALLYFLVIWLLGLALDEIERRTDPVMRKRRATHVMSDAKPPAPPSPPRGGA